MKSKIGKNYNPVNKTVKIAIKALELSELQVLLVVNIKNKFVGTVTDGI